MLGSPGYFGVTHPSKLDSEPHIREDHSSTAPHTKTHHLCLLSTCSLHMMQSRVLCHGFPECPWASPQASLSLVSKSPPPLVSSIP